MIVRLHGPNIPREFREVRLDSWEGNIEDLIKFISDRNTIYKELLMEKESVRSDLNILINGRHCMFINGLRTKIRTEDIVDILLPVIGG
ncbi:MAG: MoaD/ThiS family protein [Candidatus Methanomethyliales bacterium]|nr:MoaD/ThiS family protein [Candidatus Methanomethylicales archaeon]